MNEEHLSSHEASAEAVHAAKNAAMAVELSREAQLAEAVMTAALQTEASVLKAIREVFGDGDEQNPNQMKILVRRIPLICQDIKQIHTDMGDMRADVAKINDNISKGVWIILGAVILGLMGMLFTAVT